jgi:hypothetical protein
MENWWFRIAENTMVSKRTGDLFSKKRSIARFF